MDKTTVDFVKQWEGFRDEAYLPTENDVPTIGYGTTQGVNLGDTITEEQAEQLLARDLEEAASAVDDLVRVPLTSSQRAAVTSLVYNVGRSAFARSKALRELNRGNLDGFLDEAFDEDKGFTRQAGNKLRGLVNRRMAERDLFLYGG